MDFVIGIFAALHIIGMTASACFGLIFLPTSRKEKVLLVLLAGLMGWGVFAVLFVIMFDGVIPDDYVERFKQN